MTLRLYNTASRKVEDFIPLSPLAVTMYNCGPTVYNYAHIGNLRAYVFADILRRTLEQQGYEVNQVINITDVGHLVSDADDGEDKMTVGATREGASVEEIIKKYSDVFYADLEALNVKAAKDKGVEKHFPRATHHIDEQKNLIDKLNEKGYTYSTSDGVYFDTSKFTRYADFAKLDIDGMNAGTRVDMGEKRNATDFALWKFSPTDGVKREQEWDSPLGILRKGFPGWHVECSAMAMKYLGETIDIHTGGIDHIPVHHTNEVAQSECATGKPFARYWMHSAFMNVDGQKMSKSLGNTYTLHDLSEHEHNMHRIAYRYWLLTAHYRTQVNFTWEAFGGASSAYRRLCTAVENMGPNIGNKSIEYVDKFKSFISDDINTPQALALTWDLLKDDTVSNPDKLATLFFFDDIFGLDLMWWHRAARDINYPAEIQILLTDRQHARDAKNFVESDRLRDEIRKLGYEVKDTPEGQKLEKI